MKISYVIMAFILSGCASDTGPVDFDYLDVTYHRDPRTSLCFAAVGSSAAIALTSTGLGMTEVPCSKTVLGLIESR